MADFNLHAPVGATKKRRRVGRGQGSGLGTTAGKGNKGQQSRSGGKTYPGFEGGQMPLYRRLPHRGFTNTSFKKHWQVVNLEQIEVKYAAGETVDGGASSRSAWSRRPRALIKILGDGSVTKALTFQVDKVSASAKAKIEKAGGKVETPSGAAAPAGDARGRLIRREGRIQHGEQRVNRHIPRKRAGQRILYTLMWLALFRLGTYLPLPGINASALQSYFAAQNSGGAGGITDYLDFFAGGAFKNFSLFMLGVMPYISMQIIMQLLLVVSPKLKKVSEEDGGKKKIARWTRIGTVFVTIIESYSITIWADRIPNAIVMARVRTCSSRRLRSRRARCSLSG